MNFRKKLKVRLYFAITYIVLGLAMIVASFLFEGDHEFLSPLGLAFTVMGIARVRQYFLIMKSEESITKQQIAESDERNIAIANKSKSISFMVYVLLAAVAVIVFQFLNLPQLAGILSATISVLVLVYWVSYWILQRKY